MVVDEPVGCNSTGSLCEIHTQGIGHPSNESKVIAHHHDAGINQSVTAMTQMTILTLAWMNPATAKMMTAMALLTRRMQSTVPSITLMRITILGDWKPRQNVCALQRGFILPPSLRIAMIQMLKYILALRILLMISTKTV